MIICENCGSGIAWSSGWLPSWFAAPESPSYLEGSKADTSCWKRLKGCEGGWAMLWDTPAPPLAGALRRKGFSALTLKFGELPVGGTMLWLRWKGAELLPWAAAAAAYGPRLKIAEAEAAEAEAAA